MNIQDWYSIESLTYILGFYWEIYKLYNLDVTNLLNFHDIEQLEI